MIETPHDERKDRFAPEETLREPVSSLSVELKRISAEIQSINSGFQSQLEHAIADTQSGLEAQYAERYRREIDALKARITDEVRTDLQRQFDEEMDRRMARSREVKLELQRTAERLAAISTEIESMIEDPTVELSRVMRKKTEQAELKSYLDGLHYALSE